MVAGGVGWEREKCFDLITVRMKIKVYVPKKFQCSVHKFKVTTVGNTQLTLNMFDYCKLE